MNATNTIENYVSTVAIIERHIPSLPISFGLLTENRKNNSTGGGGSPFSSILIS
jgi:hypothetical protein